ncbi:MAG: GMP/IMP nucleotidase [Gammaproteobacteria bacterium]|nr:GMP/IMP nucleotidase [Gammaproteobacteria bacterium]
MQSRPASIPWQDVDTILLDMDGTLLDLAFDNFFWLELVPERYAALHGLGAEEARRLIMPRYERVLGTLAWYCVEHWSTELGLDIVALKHEHRHLISYLPGATRFLTAARRRGADLSIVTNAHPDTVTIKAEQTRLDTRVDRIVSSHELEAAKESEEFWRALERRQRFDPSRTLLVEDSLPVLRAAQSYGIRHTVAVRRPDSRQPPRDVAGFPAVDGVADLLSEEGTVRRPERPEAPPAQ